MDKHCLAPWTHTYLSPQSERRLCCASRESAQNFKQYIDTDTGTNEYRPTTLEEHWNSDHMKSVRKRMMAGEEIPECEVCNKKLLNTSVYRDYFEGMFGSKREQLLAQTLPDGTHKGLPISFDYRISNLCTFKCRMCGPPLSSAWESEERQHNPNFEQSNPWGVPNVRREITKFQRTVAIEELWRAIKEERIEEIYWVGGEPLDWPEHWEMMKYMVENDIAKNVYVRYNTNLNYIWDVTKKVSKYTSSPICLFDLLTKFKDWQICASLDAVGKDAEYIRTGLNWDMFVHNLSIGSKYATHNRQLRLDLTLTLPGMMQLDHYVGFADQYGVDILTKVVFAFSPDIIMSPLALPRPLLTDLVEYWVSDLELRNKRQHSLIDTLQNLLKRPTFQEQWPNEYIMGLWQGKARILELEQRRGDTYTMGDILSHIPKIKEWWDAI
jgi:organic radical activating enzyme